MGRILLVITLGGMLLGCPWAVQLDSPSEADSGLTTVNSNCGEALASCDGGADDAGPGSLLGLAALSTQCPDDGFGTQVRLSGNGDLVLIGAPDSSCADDAGTGAAYVFRRAQDAGYRLEDTLRPEPTDGGFGNWGAAVGINGTGTVAFISAPHGDVPRVCMFERTDTGWSRYGCVNRPTSMSGPFAETLSVSPVGDLAVLGTPSDLSQGGKPNGGRLHQAKRQVGRLGLSVQWHYSMPDQRVGTQVVTVSEPARGFVTTSEGVYAYTAPLNLGFGPLRPATPNTSFGASLDLSADGTFLLVGEPGWTASGLPPDVGAVHLVRVRTGNNNSLIATWSGDSSQFSPRLGTLAVHLIPGETAATLSSAGRPEARCVLLKRENEVLSQRDRPCPLAHSLASSSDGKVLAVGYPGRVELHAAEGFWP